MYHTQLRRAECSAPPAPITTMPPRSTSRSRPADCYRFTARVIHGVAGEAVAGVAHERARARGRPQREQHRRRHQLRDAGTGTAAPRLRLELLPSARMGVRRARRGERIDALDGASPTSSTPHLVITAGDEAVGVAGVIGGMATRITDATTDVLLESAAFDPKTVRRTRRALNISTDASYRFERGSDRDVCQTAAIARRHSSSKSRAGRGRVRRCVPGAAYAASRHVAAHHRTTTPRRESIDGRDRRNPRAPRIRARGSDAKRSRSWFRRSDGTSAKKRTWSKKWRAFTATTTSARAGVIAPPCRRRRIPSIVSSTGSPNIWWRAGTPSC